MAQNDLLGFVRLVTSYEVTGTPKTKWQGINWEEALSHFWGTPMPRLIYANAFGGGWVFHVVGGSDLRLKAVPPPGQGSIILRFQEDEVRVPPEIGVELDDSNWMPAISGGDDYFYCHLATVARNNPGTVMFFAAKPGLAMVPSDTHTLFKVSLQQKPVTSSTEIELDEGVKMGIIGRCRITLEPFSGTWDVANVSPTNIEVYRLDGATRVVPSIATGWNLHAYGWMLQSETESRLRSAKFLMLKTGTAPPFHYVGCFRKRDGRSGLGDQRNVSLCASGASQRNQRLFGLERQRQCWIRNGTTANFYDTSRNLDTTTSTPCTDRDNEGFPAGLGDHMSIYAGSWGNK